MLRAFHFIVVTALTMLSAAPSARAESAGETSIYMVRYFEVAPDAKKQVPPMLKQLAEQSRKEAGVLRFEILQRAAPSNQFATVELWKDKAAADAHTDAAYTKEFLTQLQPLLIAPLDNRTCDALDVSPPPQGRTPRGRRYVVTHVDVNPPNKDNAFTVLKALAEASRKEDGNIRFDVLVQQVRNQNHFQVVEVWRNQKAKDAHEISASTKEFRSKIGPLSGALYDQRRYRPL